MSIAFGYEAWSGLFLKVDACLYYYTSVSDWHSTLGFCTKDYFGSTLAFFNFIPLHPFVRFPNGTYEVVDSLYSPLDGYYTIVLKTTVFKGLCVVVNPHPGGLGGWSPVGFLKLDRRNYIRAIPFLEPPSMQAQISWVVVIHCRYYLSSVNARWFPSCIRTAPNPFPEA